MPKWCDARVEGKKVWTEGLFTISISMPDQECQVAPFEPGQFLHLAVMNDEKRINRPYSVASPHGEHLEFFIVVVPDGQLTPRLWNLEVGDKLQVSQRAAGRFTLKKTPDAEILWLLSTGTGLAPYVAMLRSEEIWERFRKVNVIHGVRFERDFGYAEELLQLQQKMPDRFRYVKTLTREDATGALRGRIPALLEDGSLEEACQCSLRSDNSSVLLCGNPAMLDDVVAKLEAREMKEHRSKSPGQIVLERYW